MVAEPEAGVGEQQMLGGGFGSAREALPVICVFRQGLCPSESLFLLSLARVGFCLLPLSSNGCTDREKEIQMRAEGGKAIQGGTRTPPPSPSRDVGRDSPAELQWDEITPSKKKRKKKKSNGRRKEDVVK